MKPTLLSIKAEYAQEPDDDYTPGHPNQTLMLEMTHCGAGPYLVITTERWAMDKPRELHKLISRFAVQVEALFDMDQGA